MIGYMALVTVLVAIFGGISLAYLWRTVGNTIRTTEALAVRAKKGKPADRVQAFDRASRSAPNANAGASSRQRLPVVHRLARHAARPGYRRGPGPIDEGAAKPHRRSHSVRGHLEFSASYPIRSRRPAGRRSCSITGIPVSDFLKPNTIEWYLDRYYQLDAQIKAAKNEKAVVPNVSTARIGQTRCQHRAESGGDGQRLLEYGGQAKGRCRPRSTKASQAETGGNKLGGRPHTTPGGRALFAGRDRGNELQRLSNDQGKGRRARLRRVLGRSTPKPAPSSRGTFSRSSEYYTNRVLLPSLNLGRLDGSRCGSMSVA